ncbi:MAG: CPBP family intramembrane metalloprotease [Chloroflexi bacterium]|nr:CPBP family intramembrane metalloprotease [Chloroflexota bacterium]
MAMKPAEAPVIMAVPWTFRDAAKAILLVVGGTAVLALALLGLPGLSKSLEGGAALLLSASLEAMLLVAIWRFGPWRYGGSWSSLGLRPTLNRGAPMALMVLFASVSFAALYTISVAILGLDTLRPPQLPSQLVDTYPLRLATFSLAVLVAPAAEEVFFRGFLLPAFVARWGFAPGAVLVSLLFAMSHGVPALLAPAFISGLLLAWLYRRTGSLWNCVLAHTAQNAMAFAVAVSV